MRNLLDEVIDAHGGIDRWNSTRHFTARMSIDGNLFARKGNGGVLKDVVVDGDTHAQFLRFTGFPAIDKRAVFRPDRVTVEALDGKVLEERDDPRAAFAGHQDETPWDDLHLVYFCGYANWNYLVTPFLMATPGFKAEEIQPWEEDGETWRRLRVSFPAGIATHSPEQTLYFNDAGLQRRIDYRAVIAGGANIAHYCWAHKKFSGIVVPTMRRALRIGSDGRVIPQPVSVDIEIFHAEFE
jgi:hypothetical protein